MRCFPFFNQQPLEEQKNKAPGNACAAEDAKVAKARKEAKKATKQPAKTPTWLWVKATHDGLYKQSRAGMKGMVNQRLRDGLTDENSDSSCKFRPAFTTLFLCPTP